MILMNLQFYIMNEKKLGIIVGNP